MKGNGNKSKLRNPEQAVDNFVLLHIYNGQLVSGVWLVFTIIYLTQAIWGEIAHSFSANLNKSKVNKKSGFWDPKS